MGHDGEGIGKADGYTLFVKDTVIGDRAEVKIMKTKKNYGYARLLKVLRPLRTGQNPDVPLPEPAGAASSSSFPTKSSWNLRKRKSWEISSVSEDLRIYRRKESWEWKILALSE